MVFALFLLVSHGMNDLNVVWFSAHVTFFVLFGNYDYPGTSSCLEFVRSYKIVASKFLASFK